MVKLTRLGDGKVINGEKHKFIEWKEDGTFLESHDEPKIGRSLIIDPQFLTFTWMTTTIVSFEIEQNYIHFKTQNSNYKLEVYEYS